MIDSSTATLIAAALAAIASILTLAFRLSGERTAESRAAYRQSLAPHLQELGNSLHMLLACSVLSVRDRDSSNREYWAEKVATARRSLRKLRPVLRYPLWGLDDGFKAIICLPDWVSSRASVDRTRLLEAATDLRAALDDCIRRAYLRGRPPSALERRRIDRRVARLRNVWTGVAESLDAEDLPSDREAPPLRHAKMYATIVTVSGDELVAEAADGTRHRVRTANRSGRGSRALAQPGTRIKLYRREGEDFLRYRFIGG